MRKPLAWWIWLAKAAAAHAIPRALLLIAIILLNPFGVVEWGEKRTRELWQEIYAEHYRPAAVASADPANARVPGRDDITVILLDAEDRKLLSRTDRPDTYDLFDMIDRVYRAGSSGESPDWKPRAIFVDLRVGPGAPPGVSADALVQWSDDEKNACTLRPKATPFKCALLQIGEITRYPDWRDQPECQSSTVAKIMCIERHGGTPLLFAEPFTEDVAGAAPLEGGKALDRVAAVVPAGFDIGRVELVWPQDMEARLNSPYRLSPAAALYGIWRGAALSGEGAPRALDARACGHGGPVVCPDDRASGWRSRYWGWSDAFERPAETVWAIGGADPFTTARESLTGGTLQKSCDVAGEGGGLALSFMAAFAAGLNAPERTPCLYTHMLHYRHLGDADAALLDRAISGKIVLIGYADAEGNDFVPAGPHEELPGVFQHAMMLDNLIVYGDDYPKAPTRLVAFLDITDSDLSNLGGALLILFPAGLATAWARARNRKLGEGKLPRAREWLWRLAVGVTAGLFSLCLILILTGQMTLVPPHYQAAALTIVVLLEFLTIIFVLTWPIRGWLFARVPALRFFDGEAPPEPVPPRQGDGALGEADADGPDGARRRKQRKRQDRKVSS